MSDAADMEVLDSILDTIGNTPLVRLRRLGQEVPADLIAKVEYFNPGGSVKDRIGINMIRAAEAKGDLKPGGTVVECTSGNTGLGLAIAASVLGYRSVFTMPDKMSLEKINLLKAMGSDVIVTPTNVDPDSPESYYKVAEKIVKETPGAYHTNQYHNPHNPEAHYKTTGPEIWRQTKGRITHFVATLGTGGTISGVGRYLKEQNPDVKVIGVDPAGSILKQYFETKTMGEAKPYLVEGIGEDMIPSTTHFQYVDEVVRVTDRECFLTARRMSREEGILVGGSCGGAVAGALKALAKTGPDHVAVVILPDTGERYLSKVHNDAWMRDNNFLGADAVDVGQVLSGKGTNIPALVSVAPEDPVRTAIDRIREHDISVIPVIDAHHKVVGAVDENTLMRRVLEDSAVLDTETGKIMGKPLPELSPQDSVESAIQILANKNPGVLVMDAGNPVGILTRIDVIGFVAQ